MHVALTVGFGGEADKPVIHVMFGTSSAGSLRQGLAHSAGLTVQ
jgi:hypothetical protein